MKKYLLLITFLHLIYISCAQNSALDYNKAFKIYNLTTYEKFEKSENINDTSSSYLLSSFSSFQIFHPTFAFQWKTKKNNFQEIELTYLKLGGKSSKTELKEDPTNNQQVISGNNVFTAFLSLQYEYILNFNKLKDKKLVPALGFGINPYYKQNNYTPKIASSYPESEMFLGTKVFVTPRLNYHLNSKVFIDVNIPVCLFDTYFLNDKSGDPELTIQDRTVKSFNFQQFPVLFNGRIGVGYKF